MIDALSDRRRNQFGEEWVFVDWGILVSARLGSSVNFEATLTLLGDEELEFITTPHEVERFLAALTSLDHISGEEALRELELLLRYIRVFEIPRGYSKEILRLQQLLDPRGKPAMELSTVATLTLSGIKRLFTYRPHLYPENCDKAGVQILVPPGGTIITPS